MLLPVLYRQASITLLAQQQHWAVEQSAAELKPLGGPPGAIEQLLPQHGSNTCRWVRMLLLCMPSLLCDSSMASMWMVSAL